MKTSDGYTLNIINTFEPIPLINILSKKRHTKQFIKTNNWYILISKTNKYKETFDINQNKIKEESAELF